MEAVLSAIMGTVLFMHACQMFGVSDRRTTGAVGLVGALAFPALLLSRQVPLIAGLDTAAMAVVWFAWATYCALVAATGLWSIDARGFGYWALLGAGTSIGEFVYSVLMQHPKGVGEGLALAVAFAALFAYLGLGKEGLRPLAAWVFLGASAVVLLLTVLVIFGIPGVV